MAVYDDEKTNTEDLHKTTGIGKDEMRDMEARAHAGADQDRAAQTDDLEQNFAGRSAGDDDLPPGHPDRSSSSPSDTVGQGYSAGSSSGKSFGRSLRNTFSFKNRFTKSKVTLALLAALVTGGITIGGFFFGFLNVFKLDHFLSNVEQRGFMRYQIDMDGRSSKWIQSYMVLRMAEIHSDKPVAERDNMFFRSNRVDTNNPLTDWYKTLRASKFEQNVFNKHGIRFVSVAREGPNNTVRFRPGFLEIDDRRINFDATSEEIRIIQSNNPNEWRKLDSKFDDFITRKTFENDREARRYIKEVVNKELKPWQVMKRRHIRKDIQNMIGIRDWRFFEKTRDKVGEKSRSVRNKLIIKALPEDTKSGKFVMCFFGMESCVGSRDPASPSNRSSGDAKNRAPGVEVLDPEDGVAVKAQFMRKVFAKVIPVAGATQTLDMLLEMNKLITNGSLSKMVVAARGAQLAGLFTTYSVARDQIKTGEVTGEEVGQFMEYSNGIGNNEAWTTALSGYKSASSINTLYAQSIKAENKDEYCSVEYQEKLKKGEVDKNQFAYSCQKIGGASNAEKVEDWWVNSPTGKIIQPILSALDDGVGGGVSRIARGISDFIGLFVDPVVKGFLAVTGLGDDVEKALMWIAEKSMEELGAGPMTDTDTPAPVDGGLAAQGGTWLAEWSMRNTGAARTTATTRADTIKRIAAHKQENNPSLYTRYLALDNPTSIASMQLYAVSTSKIKDLPGYIGSMFSSLISIPELIGSAHTRAADRPFDDGYSLARFAEIETYDYPSVCINGDIFSADPQSLTNADELGLIPSSELTWDLIKNKEQFYDRLYQDSDDEDTIVQVYNCGLLDNAIRGSLGAMYGYTDDNAIQSTGGSSKPDTEGSETAGAEIVGDPFTSSVNIKCANGTEDVGVHDAYNNGEKIKMRMCAVSNLSCSNQECVEIGKGKAIVNSRVSGAVYALVEAAKASGVTLTASSSFRTMAHQESLCPCDGESVATPGYSNHQSGTAIDFSDAGNEKKSGATCSNRARGDGYAGWEWLFKNASKFGYKQYSVESWHWDPMDADNRCG